MITLTDDADSPWLDVSAYPNLAPDNAVPDPVLAVLRDVLRAPEVPSLRPDVWHDVLHGAVHPAGSEADDAGHDSREPESNEHTTGDHGAHGQHWQAPDPGGHTWHGPGMSPHGGGPGGHGPGADGLHDGGSHDGGILDGGGHG